VTLGNKLKDNVACDDKVTLDGRAAHGEVTCEVSVIHDEVMVEDRGTHHSKLTLNKKTIHDDKVADDIEPIITDDDKVVCGNLTPDNLTYSDLVTHDDIMTHV
jgi:hypothetical protein